MKCVLRTGDVYSDKWHLFDINDSSPGQNVDKHTMHESDFHQASFVTSNAKSSRGVAEIYFTPLLSIKSPHNSSMSHMISPPEQQHPSTPRSRRLVPTTLLDESTEQSTDLNIPVRPTSPEPFTQQYTVVGNGTASPAHRRSVSRSRLSTPENRLRAASFFAVKTSPNNLIEEYNHMPFTVSIGDISLVELVCPSSILQSSIKHALILITLNTNEILEITFHKIDALEILHAFLCAMVPSARRKVRIEEVKMMDFVDEPAVDDMANFEANAMEDCFRNESYLDKMSRRSTRMFLRLCDGMSFLLYAILCLFANLCSSDFPLLISHNWNIRMLFECAAEPRHNIEKA